MIHASALPSVEAERWADVMIHASALPSVEAERWYEKTKRQLYIMNIYFRV